MKFLARSFLLLLFVGSGATLLALQQGYYGGGYGGAPGYGEGYGSPPGYGGEDDGQRDSGGSHTLPYLPYYGEEGG